MNEMGARVKTPDILLRNLLLATRFVEYVTAGEAYARSSIEHIAAANHAEIILRNARRVCGALVFEASYASCSVSAGVISQSSWNKMGRMSPDVFPDVPAARMTAG
jgi:hypothetical protein